MADALNVMVAFEGSTSNEPLTGPLLSPTNVTFRSGLAAVPPQRLTLAGTNGLLKATVKPVAVGVKEVTVKPRTVMALLAPAKAGFVACVSVAMMVWLPAAARVRRKVWAPLSLPDPVVNV